MITRKVPYIEFKFREKRVIYRIYFSPKVFFSISTSFSSVLWWYFIFMWALPTCMIFS